jgi:GntR family transcriptional regulator
MDPQWDDSLPIYRQLRDRIVAMILEEALREGDPLCPPFAASPQSFV